MAPGRRQGARRRTSKTPVPTPQAGRPRSPPEPESLTQHNDATSRGPPSARGATALRILASSRNLFGGNAFVDKLERQIKPKLTQELEPSLTGPRLIGRSGR